ncbi:MAG: Sjogren's syndrome/scleroderma autoantigen 1 family protein [Haloferacaceae archaeon]
MSDFDREAERERLREKYENDQRERQSTQRMSELLLKGATMTNRHCDECGDPIFRHDGTEFCPTCQHEAATGGAAEEGATPADADAVEGTSQGADASMPADGRDATPPTPDGDVAPADADVETPDPGRVDESSATPDAPQERRPAGPTGGEDRSGADSAPERAAGEGRPAPTPAAAEGTTARMDEGGRAAARASLERSLARFAREAEGADDPRRAQDLLAAAREAAEALAALDRR